jgi:hypothetical protein
MKTFQNISTWILFVSCCLSCGNTGSPNKNQPQEKQNADSIATNYPVYNGGTSYSGDINLVRQNGKIGFVDERGKEIIPCVYDSIVSTNCDWSPYFDNIYAKVQQSSKWGIINRNGDMIIPCIYEDVYVFDFNKTDWLECPYIHFFSMDDKLSMAVVKQNGKWGLINKQGKIAAQCIYDEIFIPVVEVFYEGRVAVKQNGKWGFLNTKGENVIPFIYEKIWSEPINGSERTFSNGLAVVKKDDKWGAIDVEGNEKVPFIFDVIYSWYSNFDLTGAQKDGKWGFIDKTGNAVIPIIYDGIQSFDGSMCLAKQNGKWGFLNEKGETVIPFIYDEIQTTFDMEYHLRFFWADYCAVKKDGKWGLIDTANNTIIPFEYDEIKNMSTGMDDDRYFYEGCSVVRKGKNVGLVNKQGVEIVPCEYESAEAWGNGRVRIKKNGKYGAVDTLGNIVVPLQHDEQTIKAILSSNNE